MTLQSANRTKTISEVFREHTQIDRAVKEAVRQALLRHKLLGQSIVVWRDGKCVWISPEDIEVPPAPPTEAAADPMKHAG